MKIPRKKSDRRPLDLYLENTSSPELCRSALILPQAKEIAYARLEKFWLDVNNEPVLQPLSLEAYLEENLILVHLDKVTAQINHKQLVTLMSLGEGIKV